MIAMRLRRLKRSHLRKNLKLPRVHKRCKIGAIRMNPPITRTDVKTQFLKRCDILLYKGESFTSRLIQWRTKSPYSHVAVVVEPAIDLGIESNTGHQSGVRAFDLKGLDSMRVDVFRVKDEFAVDKEKVISFLVGHLGASYDYSGVFWLATLKLFNLRSQANRFQKKKDYFCSELVYEAFREGGLDVVPQVGEADITSPSDIAQSPRLVRLDAG